jgi:hypothetical protein
MSGNITGRCCREENGVRCHGKISTRYENLGDCQCGFEHFLDPKTMEWNPTNRPNQKLFPIVEEENVYTDEMWINEGETQCDTF